MEEKIRLLEGIKVLDLTNNMAGPCTAVLLAERGAEVIHVERPGIGDDSRHYLPLLPEGVCGVFAWANRGKKSVTLDLKDERAKELLYKMAKDADIFIESYRPGVLDRLGYGYEKMKEINPRLIYCSVSVFGHTGPNRHKPGYDLIAQAYSGIVSMTGEPDGPPHIIGYALGDTVGSINAYGNIMAALYARTITGKGQHVDISLARGLLWQHGSYGNSYTGKVQRRFGNHAYGVTPYGLFNGKDESVIIASSNDNVWGRLCDAMGRPDLKTDPDYATNRARVSNKMKTVGIIEDWLKTFDSMDDACAVLDEHDVPAHKINEDDLMWKDQNALECGWISAFPTPDGVTSFDEIYGTTGTADLSGVMLEGTKKAPDLGQHNYEVMREYGLTDEEIEKMLSDWAK